MVPVISLLIRAKLVMVLLVVLMTILFPIRKYTAILLIFPFQKILVVLIVVLVICLGWAISIVKFAVGLAL